jgi:hypothetical protein
MGSVGDTPSEYSLKCYPNPMVKHALVSYSVPRSGRVNISVYDVAGRCICVLHDGSVLPGRYTFQWNGVESQGVYYLKMKSDGFEKTEKIIVVR